MPYTRVWIHFVWSTKKRKPVLNDAVRKGLFDHIKNNSIEKGIFIDCVNGYIDHVHCLISLGADQNISKVMQLIKGESAYWFNKQKLIDEKLEWQDEYYAVSVSESRIVSLRKYIKNQSEYHKGKAFLKECDELFLKEGIEKLK